MTARALIQLARMLVLENAKTCAKPYDVASYMHIANMLEHLANELQILVAERERLSSVPPPGELQ